VDEEVKETVMYEKILGQLGEMIRQEKKDVYALPMMGAMRCLKWINDNERYGFVTVEQAVRMDRIVMEAFELV
jgi:hypothetical protein